MNRTKVLTLLLIAIFILTLTTVSYAYIKTETDNFQSFNVTSGDIYITYNDCNTQNDVSCGTINADLKVGESFSKKFTIENTGNVVEFTPLYFTEIKNTFTNNELEYAIKDLDNNTIVKNGVVPYNLYKSYNVLIDNFDIPANTTKHYEMIVTFKIVNANQNYNLNAEFFLKLGISPVTERVAVDTTTLDNGNIVRGTKIKMGSEEFYVISNTNGIIRMLAKYNLNLGNLIQEENTIDTTEYSTVDQVVNQGSTCDHSGNVGQGSEPCYSRYEGSILEGYINEYIDYLEDTYDVEISGDTVTKAEMDSFNCTTSAGSCDSTYPWFYETLFWTSAYEYNNSFIWHISPEAKIGYNRYDNINYGVRPVITIDESEL